jgi:putative oxidoreductase
MLATATYHSWAISLSLLLIRVALGGMIAAHGLNKIFGGGKIAGTAGWFHSIGMRPGVPNAWAAAITEVGAGLFLILGLITPVACAGLVALMVVAIITVHRANGFFVFNAGQGIEYCLIVAAIAIGLGGLGAGNWSLDHVAKIWTFQPWVGLVVAAGVGIGGAFLQLAAFFRPSKVASES